MVSYEGMYQSFAILRKYAAEGGDVIQSEDDCLTLPIPPREIAPDDWKALQALGWVQADDDDDWIELELD